jgi:hypothetical protein
MLITLAIPATDLDSYNPIALFKPEPQRAKLIDD